MRAGHDLTVCTPMSQVTGLITSLSIMTCSKNVLRTYAKNVDHKEQKTLKRVL